MNFPEPSLISEERYLHYRDRVVETHTAIEVIDVTSLYPGISDIEHLRNEFESKGYRSDVPVVVRLHSNNTIYHVVYPIYAPQE